MLKKLLNINLFGRNENVKTETQEQPDLFPKAPPQQEELALVETSRQPSKTPQSVEKSPNEILLDELKSLIKNLPEEKRELSFGLVDLPTRCANALQREQVETPAQLLSLSNTDILRWNGFGKKSINDLIITIKEISSADLKKLDPVVALEEKPNWVDEYLAKHPDQQAIFEENAITDEDSYLKVRGSLESDVAYKAGNFRYDFLSEYIDRKNPIELLKICPAWLQEMDTFYFECDTRLKNIIAKNDIKVMRDFGKFEIEELRRLQNMGNKSISALAEYIHKAKQKGPPPSEENMKLSYKNLGDAFNASLSKIKDDKHRFIIEQRLGVTGPVKTLEETAQELGLTRERVRQIQKKITQKIIDGEFWDDYLKMRVVSVMENPDSPVYMDKLSEVDPWLAGFEGNEQLLKSIIVYFSHLEPKFLDHNGRTILCHISNDEWEKLKSELLESFEYSLDLQYTMEDIEMMIENRLAGFESKELASLMFDKIYPVLNFSANDLDMVLSSIGNSLSSHLKAILNEEPEPLHYSKIRNLYQERYGVDVSERNVHARLNYGDFLLFNRGTYGTQRHLTLSESEQKDIREQAETFLEKHANRQCHSHEILKSINEHDIDKFILNIIVQKSEKATYLGKMVWIFGNDDEESQRLPIKETIASILKKKGRPMRIEELEKEISKVRSVGAYFSVNLQPNELFSRIDPATWGLLERDFILPEKKWRAIKDYLVEYFTKTNQALHTSEFNQIVQKLDLDKKITVGHIVGVLSADDRFRKWRGGFVGLSSWSTPQRITLDEAIDIVLKNHTNQNFTLEAIEDPLKEVLGYEFEKYRVATHLNKKGYEYDRDKNFWVKAA